MPWYKSTNPNWASEYRFPKVISDAGAEYPHCEGQARRDNARKGSNISEQIAPYVDRAFGFLTFPPFVDTELKTE